MPKTKAKAAPAVSKIHAVVGSDESEVKRVAAELAAKLTPPDAGDFGLEMIDGAADNAEQAATRIRSTIEALQTIALFGRRKIGLVEKRKLSRRYCHWALGQCAIGARRTCRRHRVAIWARKSTFLFSATEVDKRRSFYKALAKRAEVQVFDKLDSSRSGWEEEATEIVRGHAAKRKLQFDDEALDLFVLLTGGDTRQIENELEKIDIFLGKERRVNVDLVRELVPLSRAGVIFELGNALAERDLERALTLVKNLLDQGETAIGILLVAVIPTVRNLLLTKDLMDRHRLSRPHAPFQFISVLNRLPAAATAHLPRKKMARSAVTLSASPRKTRIVLKPAD